MPSITSLISKLRSDFPHLAFTSGDTFRWSPNEQTIYYDKDSTDAPALLHELAHAALEHASYTRDIELIEMERDAWSYAQKTFSPRYDVLIDDDLIQDSLDTYRDWLHARSLCPSCQATGLQTRAHRYRCVACGEEWRANDARVCSLRRYKLP